MPRHRAPRPTVLVFGIHGADPDLIRRCRQLIAKRFGPLDLDFAPRPALDADALADTMGADVLWTACAAAAQTPPSRLVEAAHEAAFISEKVCEEALSPDLIEPVRVGVGYVTEHKLVLAAMTDAASRVFISNGVFAGVDAVFAGDHCLPASDIPLNWTAPDAIALLRAARRRAIAADEAAAWGEAAWPAAHHDDPLESPPS